jgi:hypothetical protein
MDDGNAAALAETLATIAAQRRQPDGLSAIRMHEHWWMPSMTWVVIFVMNGVRAPQALACFGHTALQNAVCSALYADLCRYDTDKKRIRPVFRLSPDPWGIGSELLRDGAWMFRRSVLVADTCLLRAGDVRLALACRLPVAPTYTVDIVALPDGSTTVHAMFRIVSIAWHAAPNMQISRSLSQFPRAITIIAGGPASCASWRTSRGEPAEPGYERLQFCHRNQPGSLAGKG